MTPTNEAITETEAGFGSGLRAQIERRRGSAQETDGNERPDTMEAEPVPPPQAAADHRGVDRLEPLPDEAFEPDAPAAEPYTPESVAELEAEPAFTPDIGQVNDRLDAQAEELAEWTRELQAREEAARAGQDETARALFVREQELTEREQTLAARQKELEAKATRRSSELLAERQRLQAEAARIESRADVAAAEAATEERPRELPGLESAVRSGVDLGALAEQLSEREAHVVERENELAVREGRLRDAEVLLESERVRLERREDRVSAGEASVVERIHELDERERVTDQREAFLETDIELRLEKLVRRERDVETRERRVDHKEGDLVAFVARAQTELHRRESLLRGPGA